MITSLGLRYERRFGRMRDRAGDPTAVARAGGIERVDAVTGCLMLVRRDVFAAIGLLDEDYFFSFEDLDFCLKAAAAGYASVLVRSATVFHEGSRSIGPDSPGRLYFAARNHLRAGARLAPSSGQMTAAARFISIVALNTAHAIGAPGGTLPQRLAAVWEGTRDYLAGTVRRRGDVSLVSGRGRLRAGAVAPEQGNRDSGDGGKHHRQALQRTADSADQAETPRAKAVLQTPELLFHFCQRGRRSPFAAGGSNARRQESEATSNAGTGGFRGNRFHQHLLGIPIYVLPAWLMNRQ